MKTAPFQGTELRLQETPSSCLCASSLVPSTPRPGTNNIKITTAVKCSSTLFLLFLMSASVWELTGSAFVS